MLVPLSEYEALLAKVDAFHAEVGLRRVEDLRCAPGCTACCQVQLSVSPVEAAFIRRHLARLPAAQQAALAERARQVQAHDGAGPCVMLGEDGRCAIYPARPLLCRTQGLPLRYPDGLIPAAAVRARCRGTEGAITWCPLNFRGRPPQRADVLDAGLVDEVLALVNRRYAGPGPLALERTSLADLAYSACQVPVAAV